MSAKVTRTAEFNSDGEVILGGRTLREETGRTTSDGKKEYKEYGVNLTVVIDLELTQEQVDYILKDTRMTEVIIRAGEGYWIDLARHIKNGAIKLTDVAEGNVLSSTVTQIEEAKKDRTQPRPLTPQEYIKGLQATAKVRPLTEEEKAGIAELFALLHQEGKVSIVDLPQVK